MSKEALPSAPYKGLIPYSEEDADLFFGREPEREIITANLMASRLTLLYGASGVGKSSVLRAGVAHHLRRVAAQNLAKRGVAELAVVVFREWRDNPLGGLTAEVQRSIARTFGETADRVSTDGTFGETLKAAAERIGGRLLIILDQFEEYFLYHAQEDGEGTFAVEFPRAVNNPDLPVSFMISIREDALAKLDRFEGRIPNLFDNYLRVEHLDRDSARDAITKPVAHYNDHIAAADEKVSIEPLLIEEVLDQVQAGKVGFGEAGRGVVSDEEAAGQIETPFLQLVMTRLWNEEMKRGSRWLRLQTLHDLGGAKSIIKTHLDEAMSGLKVEEQETASRIFRYLVTPSGAKIAHSAGDLAEYVRLSKEQIEPVLDELSSGDNRILRPVAPPPDEAGPVRYEIYHDVLAQAILDYAKTRERIETERQLEQEAKEREKAERQLAREQRLVRRQRWGLAAMTLLLLMMIGAIVFAFQQKAEANTQKNKAEAALSIVSSTRDELQVSLKDAEEQRARADAQRDAAEIAKTEADNQRLAAERSKAEEAAQRKVADEARAKADEQTRIAQNALEDVTRAQGLANRAAVEAADRRAEAELAKADAEKQTLIARSRELAATAVVQLPLDPELGMILALKAVSIAPTLQAEQSLRQALLESPLPPVLRGHKEEVFEADFSPDGNRLISASRDGTAQIWDVKTGESLHVLRGHKGLVTLSAFSPDNKYVATTSDDRIVRLWDAVRGSQLKELAGHDSTLDDIVFSGDGKHLMTSDGSRLRLWDLETGRTVNTIEHHSKGRIAISPDGNFIATLNGNLAQVRNVVTGQVVTELRGHMGEVTMAQFNGDARYIATSGEDQYVRVWDARTGQMIRELGQPQYDWDFFGLSPDGSLLALSRINTVRIIDVKGQTPERVLRGHTDWLRSFSFSPDGRRIVTGGADSTARVWDTSTGQRLKELRGHKGSLNTVEFSPDGSRIATASTDGTVRLWDVYASQEAAVLRGSSDELNHLASSPDGRIIAASNRDGTIYLWDASTGENLRELPGITDYSGWNNTFAFSPDGKLIATASTAGVVLSYPTTGEVFADLRGRKREMNFVRFSTDGKYLVTAGEDGAALVWEVSSHNTPIKLKAQNSLERNAVFSPDGKLVITLNSENVLHIWDLKTGQNLKEMGGQKDIVYGLAFNPDGSSILTWSADKTARIWDASTGQVLKELRGHTGPVYSGSFSPDGKLVLTSSSDHTAKLWDAKTGEMLKDLVGHTNYVDFASFSPDGKLIVTASTDEIVRVWDVSTGRSLKELRGHTGRVYKAIFSPDGKSIITVSEDTTSRIYKYEMFMPYKYLVDLAGKLVKRDLTPDEQEEYLHIPKGK